VESRVHSLAGCPIFTVGEQTYIWEDLLLAAYLWGGWEGLSERARTGLGCLARLAEIEDQEAVLPEAELSEAAAEFRYARDLGGADAMEAWLERRGLDADAWLDTLRRQILLLRWESELPAIRDQYDVDEEECERAIEADLLCLGEAGRLAAKLAECAAIQARFLDENKEVAEEAPDAAAEIPEVPPEGFVGLDAEQASTRLAHLARAEAHYERFAAGPFPERAIRDQLSAHQLEWTRVGARVLALSTLDAAREAALCVRVDGLDLAEVGALTHGTVEEWDRYVEETPPELQGALGGAKPGEILGPYPFGDRVGLVVVTAKRLPDENDAAIRARASTAILAAAVTHEVTNRVRWHETL
jgi:hypothetical protein